jgi:hypothetical protein
MIKPMNVLLYASSVAILIFSLLFAYLAFAPLNVLNDWQIIVDGSVHHPGETVSVVSQYKKLKNVSGLASRYLECKNFNGSYTRYPVSTAKANRSAGTTATGVFIKIPTNIPGLPTKCRVSISIDYKVYTFRTATEANSSKDFSLVNEISSIPSDRINK